ncbi:MAG: HNH endonuclease [Phycisphaerae bacterium]|nr:HNH endonuclease [Phycisphaerae bacterium]|tara:strand:+ start:102 stop:773 length:672 start_codon:yes stop_codon:yes gene_type:complete
MAIAIPRDQPDPPHDPRGTSGLDSSVLLLNRLYTAIRVIDARRAFSLLTKEVAEVIAVEDGTYRNYDFATWTDIAELQQAFEPERHDWVRTTRLTIAVPKIIRVLDFDRRPRRSVTLNRRNIYARDHNLCQYCGRSFSTRELTLDHVNPRVQGGENTWTNLVCACVRCNARKGGRTPRQAGMRLIRPPVKPRRNPAITIRLGAEKYESWKAFLDEAYWTIELQ